MSETNYKRLLLRKIDAKEPIYRLMVAGWVEGLNLPHEAYECTSEGLIALDLGMGLARPTILFFEDKGIATDLSFDGTVCECFIPWDSIAIVLIPQKAFISFGVHPPPEPTVPEDPDTQTRLRLVH